MISPHCIPTVLCRRHDLSVILRKQSWLVHQRLDSQTPGDSVGLRLSLISRRPLKGLSNSITVIRYEPDSEIKDQRTRVNILNRIGINKTCCSTNRASLPGETKTATMRILKVYDLLAVGVVLSA
jgi:hypothetical protein